MVISYIKTTHEIRNFHLNIIFGIIRKAKSAIWAFNINSLLN